MGQVREMAFSKYDIRVSAYEMLGMTTSDAQAAVDAEEIETGAVVFLKTGETHDTLVAQQVEDFLSAQAQANLMDADKLFDVFNNMGVDRYQFMFHLALIFRLGGDPVAVASAVTEFKSTLEWYAKNIISGTPVLVK